MRSPFARVLLSGAMLAFALPCLADCLPLHHGAPSIDGRIRLQGVPGQRYHGWLVEGGRELRLRDGEQVLSALPARHARVPLSLQADPRGDLVLQVEAGHGPADATLNIQLDCDAEAGAWSALGRIARLAARQAAAPTPLRGWRLSWALFGALQRDDLDPRQRLWLLQQHYGLARRTGFMEQAAGWAALAATEADRQGREIEQALAQRDRGRALLTLDVAAAQQASAAAEAAFARLGMRYQRAIARHEHCLARRVRGEVEGPIDCYRAVAAELAQLGEHLDLITVQNNLTTALFFAGRYGEGRAVLEANRALVAAHGSPAHRARLALLESQLATWRADFDTALAALFEARDVFEQDSDPRGVAQVDRLLGHRYTLAGQPGRALSYYRRSRKVLHDFGLQRGEVQLLLYEARALESLGDLEQARQLAADAERLTGAGANSIEWRNAVLTLAELDVRLGRGADVPARLAELDGQLTAAQERRRRNVLIELAALDGVDIAALRELLDKDLALGRLPDALRSASLLTERLVRDGDDRAALQVIARLQAELRPVLLRLRTPGTRDALLAQLHALHALRTVDWAEGRVADDEALALVGALDALVPQPPGIAHDDDRLVALERWIGEDLLGTEGAESAIARDRALLGLSAAPREEAAPPLPPAAFTGPGVLAYPVMRRDAGGLLLHEADGWRWLPVDLPALRRVRVALHEQLAAGHADGETLQALAGKLARALRAEQWLLQPGAVRLVSHGEVAGLPLEWLRLSLRPDSAGSLVWLQRAAVSATLPPRRLALIGASGGSDSPLPGLNEIGPELAEVRTAWVDLPAQAPAATRDALLAALGSPGALVHVAAHARSAALREEEAGLWLQDADGAPAFVSALRLRRSPIRAALVVLSACESGYSAPGAGFSGVAGSLAEAGAGAVVATRWPVGDRTARRFAAQFHGALRDRPDAPEAALQKAIDALRSHPATRHPTHWAGWFVLRRNAAG